MVNCLSAFSAFPWFLHIKQWCWERLVKSQIHVQTKQDPSMCSIRSTKTVCYHFLHFLQVSFHSNKALFLIIIVSNVVTLFWKCFLVWAFVQACPFIQENKLFFSEWMRLSIIRSLIGIIIVYCKTYGWKTLKDHYKKKDKTNKGIIWNFFIFPIINYIFCSM